MVNIILTQQGPSRNIGEQALLKSEMAFLYNTFNDVNVSVFTLYAEKMRKSEPAIESFSPLIDLQIKSKNAPLFFYPFLLLIQILCVCCSLIAMSLNLKPWYRAEVIEKFKQCDIVISGGTQAFGEFSIFQKNPSISARLTNLFYLFWGVYDVFLTKKVFKKPFMTFPQSIGPFYTKMGKVGMEYILKNADIILLRESYSLNLIADLRKRAPIFVAADMAFLFQGGNQRKITLSKPVIGVSPCFPHSFSINQRKSYVKVHSEVLDYMIEKYDLNVVFLPSVIGQGETERLEKAVDDFEVCRLIYQNMINKNAVTILSIKTAEEFHDVESQLDILIATRMHPSILASISHVPSVVIIYEHKQIGLMRKLMSESLSLSINDVRLENLQSKVEYAWNNKEQIRSNLFKIVSRIQKQTREFVKRAIYACLY